jgi:hypothetical protein
VPDKGRDVVEPRRREAAALSIGVDYQITLIEAEAALRAAVTAEDVRNTWRRYNAMLGHRALGRLLLGRTAAELLARHKPDRTVDPDPED